MRAAAAGFLALSLIVWSGPHWLTDLDQQISDAMRSPGTIAVAGLLTHAGDPPVLTVLLLIAIWTQRSQARFIVGAALAVALTRWALLPVIASPRPDLPYAAGLGFSYPSGHAVYTACAAIVLFYLSLPYIKSRTQWTVLVIVTCLWPAMVGTTRVILGAHWPSDVVGGVLLTLAVLPLVARAAGTDHTPPG